MFKDFRSYQLAKELYQKCQKLKVSGEVKSQLQRASLSICLNLAEGAGKRSPKERARFFTIALGSLRETQSLLDLLDEQGLYSIADYLGAHIWKLRLNPGQLPGSS